MTKGLLSPPAANWAIGQNQKSFYSLALVVDNGTINGAFSGTRFNEMTMEFSFNVDPQSIDVEEPAAVQIVPTQNRGQYIEHQGNIFKNINIKGTTGLRPNRNRPGGVTPMTWGKKPGLPDNEVTGFDDLVSLVNLFRMYFHLKGDPTTAPDTVMVWKNGREGEYFVVEPIVFKTSRSSSSPMTTNYEISLRTVERYEAVPIVDAQGGLFDKAGWRTRVKELIAAFSKTLASVNRRQDNLISAGASYITDILQPANDLLNALTVFGETSRRIAEVPRYAVANLLSNVDNARDSMNELATNYTRSGQMDNYKILSNDLKKMGDILRGIFSETQLFGSEAGDRADRKIKAYENRLSSSSNMTASDLRTLSSGAAVGDIHIGEDIRKVAKRLNGQANSWKSLVVLNDLKPPYISSTGDGVNVLRPGVDKIMFPVGSVPAETSISREPGSRATYETIYGRDVKLGPALNETRDVLVGTSGDFALIEGVANVSQAVDIKFNVEQGELAAHDRFGIKFPIGQRGNSASSLTDFNINARNTLLSDTRIASIKRLEFTIVGNTITVQGDAQLIDGSDSLSVSLEVRR